jgi:GT2 family glycosyltransferase
VHHKVNRRLPGSINSGFSISRGRYLTWTSDDNLYRSDALARMVNALEQDATVSLVYSAMTYIDADQYPQGPGYSGGPPDLLAYRNPVGACFLYRREVYETIGDYAEDLFLVEDWDYWIRVAAKFGLRALPDDLYLYRVHEGSLTRQRQASVRQAQRRLLQRHLPNMTWTSRASRCHGYLAAARIARNAGDRRDARRLIVEALGVSPTHTIALLAGEIVTRMRGNHKRPKEFAY